MSSGIKKWAKKKRQTLIANYIIVGIEASEELNKDCHYE